MLHPTAPQVCCVHTFPGLVVCQAKAASQLSWQPPPVTLASCLPCAAACDVTVADPSLRPVRNMSQEQWAGWLIHQLWDIINTLLKTTGWCLASCLPAGMFSRSVSVRDCVVAFLELRVQSACLALPCFNYVLFHCTAACRRESAAGSCTVAAAAAVGDSNSSLVAGVAGAVWAT